MMRLGGMRIVTVIAPIVTVAASIVTPAVAEIRAVCGTPVHVSAATSSTPSTPAKTRAASFDLDRLDHQIALAQDEHGYDLITNWHQSGEQSLRATGADIYAMELGSSLVHLMVGRDQESLEHYVFSLDTDGLGELLWSSEAAGPDGAVSSRTSCTKPR